MNIGSLVAIGAILMLAEQTAAPLRNLPGSAQSRTGAVSGRVVDAVRGHALEGVAVSLVTTAGRPQVMWAQTARDGAFRFDEVAAGTYRLYGERVGYLKGVYGARPRSRLGAPLSVADRSTLNVTLELSPQAVITGRTVADDGKVVGFLPVQLLQALYFMGEKRLLPATAPARSNELGEFRFAGLAPGRYYLQAGPTNVGQTAAVGSLSAFNISRGFLPTYFPSSPSADSAVHIDLTAGAEINGLDIFLGRDTPRRVSGFYESGDPELGVENVTLVLHRYEGDEISLMPSYSYVVSKDGRFDFAAVTPGSYLVTARAQVPKYRVTFHSLLVGDDDVTNVVLTGSPGSNISVLASFEGGRAVDEETPRVRAELRPAANPLIFFAMGPAGPEGKDTIQGVVPGLYLARITSLPGGTCLKSATLNGTDVLAGAFPVRAASNQVLRVVLGRDCGTVANTVVDSKLKPVAGGTVIIVPLDQARRAHFIRFAIADQQGHVEFADVAPGQYLALAATDMDPAVFEDSTVVDKLRPRMTAIVVPSNGSVSLHLTAANVDL